LIDPERPVKYFAKLGWVKTIDASRPLKEAAELMASHGFRHAPVTSAGRLVGFISIKDIISVLNSANAHDLLKEEVSKFMSRKVIAAHPDDPLWETLKAMAEADVGAVPLINDDGVPVGIFTERDVVINVAPELAWEGPVESLATQRLSCVEPGTPLGDAIDLMDELKVRHLPVVESFRERGPAEGMVTALGITDYVLKNLKRLPKDLKADPVSTVLEDYGYVPKGAPLADAVRALAGSRGDALLVLGENRSVEGILTDRDVMLGSAKFVEKLAVP